MATAITITTCKTPFAAVAANGLDITWVAGDVAGNTFAVTGHELLLAWNTHAADAGTFTVTSKDDEKGRSEDITGYSLSAGEQAYVTAGLTTSAGWMDATTRLITVTPSATTIKFAVLRLPNVPC